MEKLLTVCKSAQGAKYTKAIILKGDWLEKYNFDFGDFVKVSISKEKIIIEKNVNTILLKQMGAKNPRILEMIENIGLTI